MNILLISGVLYDLFGKEGTATEGEEDSQVTTTESGLPWTITVHFGNAPADKVLRCPNREVVESQFMSALKEADFLKHRGQVISTMQKKDHSQLWLGLINGEAEYLSHSSIEANLNPYLSSFQTSLTNSGQ